jgi:pimeloyl-ACP methyl ester carboxylesterase
MSAFAQLYPFQSHRLDLDGHRLHYLDEGQGPAVLLLHGNPTWSFYYRELVKGLRTRYRVIVPDHLGCGLSDKPAVYPYGLETHVANCRRLVEALQLETFVLGMHDWGGPIGMGLAVGLPARIAKLVVFNSTCEPDADYPWRIKVCRWPLLGPLAVQGLNAFARAATRLACTRRAMPPDVRAGYLRPYDTWAHRVAILRFVRDIPLDPAHPARRFGEAVVRQLGPLQAKPLLICWGDRDFCFTPRFLAAWQRAFPQAEVHRFADAGHYVVEDAAADILPLLERFLAR